MLSPAALPARCGSTPRSRALYATDLSIYRQVPIGVVIPKDEADVESPRSRLAARRGAPILSRGGGTSLAGQCCNVAVGHRFLEIHAPDSGARPGTEAAPGCSPASSLDRAARRRREHDLTFAPDPATHSHCTLGGNDRQQLLRRARAHGPARPSTISRSSISCLRRHAAHGCGATTKRSCEADHRSGGGRRGRDLCRPERASATPLRRPDPRSAIRRSRAASPATTSTSCCPKTAFT